MKNLAKLFVVVIVVLSQVSCAQSTKKTAEIKIKTSAVCGMCKEKIEKELQFEKGVTAVTLDSETKICSITYKIDKTTPEKLRMAISKIGYDADEVLADPKAYEKLSPCCKKDAGMHE
jgi:copper chaperone CopZ